MSEIQTYKIEDINRLSQMHDEIVNRFDYDKDNFILYIDNLQLNSRLNLKKCKIIFSVFEDLFYDVYFIFFKFKKNKIKYGKKIYLEELLKNKKNKKFEFEILDIFLGYNVVLLSCKVYTSKKICKSKFHLYIHSKYISYYYY